MGKALFKKKKKNLKHKKEEELNIPPRLAPLAQPHEQHQAKFIDKKEAKNKTTKS